MLFREIQEGSAPKTSNRMSDANFFIATLRKLLTTILGAAYARFD